MRFFVYFLLQACLAVRPRDLSTVAELEKDIEEWDAKMLASNLEDDPTALAQVEEALETIDDDEDEEVEFDVEDWGWLSNIVNNIHKTVVHHVTKAAEFVAKVAADPMNFIKRSLSKAGQKIAKDVLKKAAKYACENRASNKAFAVACDVYNFATNECVQRLFFGVIDTLKAREEMQQQSHTVKPRKNIYQILKECWHTPKCKALGIACAKQALSMIGNFVCAMPVKTPGLAVACTVYELIKNPEVQKWAKKVHSRIKLMANVAGHAKKIAFGTD